MHDLVLVVEVLREATRGDILDLPLEHFGNGITHLLQNVQEEHQLVLSLLAIRHVLIELVNSRLQLLVLLEDAPSLLRLPLKLAAVAVKDQVKLGPLRPRLHLLLKHEACPLLVVHDLGLKMLDFVVTLINLLRHPLHTAPRLVFIPLEMLNLLVGRLKLVLLGLNQLACRAVLLVALLDLVLLRQNQCRDSLVNLA